MNGFTFKNLVLQLIHGSILLCTLLLAGNTLFNHSPNFPEIDLQNLQGYEALLSTLFFCAAFVLGVFVDVLSDQVEVLLLHRNLLTPPSYPLLQTGHHNGIELAHHEYIHNQLVKIANEHSASHGENYFMDKKRANILFQVAKNKVFRECENFQRDQIESFFMLYIFSRNLVLTNSVAALICFFATYNILGVSLLAAAFVSLLAAKRYGVYYARIVLGATFKPIA